MIYTDFKGEKISQLGFGTMRLPVINGVDKDIDEEKALEMFDYAYKHGINYFDTAWGYHEGNAEIVVGKALSRYPRESFHLTTKFPGYDRNNFPKVKEIFAKQLEKLQTEYFDFYSVPQCVRIQYRKLSESGIWSEGVFGVGTRSRQNQTFGIFRPFRH